MTARRIRSAGLAFILALTLAPSALAQIARGTLFGRAADESGAVLPGVTVTLSGDLGNRTTTTDSQGEYRFLNVDQGRHTLTAALAGFSGLTREVVVRTGDNVRVDLDLVVAAVEETVTVTAETPVIDPKRVGTTTVITKDELAGIPTSRDPWALMRTIPGVSVDRVIVAGSESGQQSQFISKGTDPKDAVWAIDGVVITDMAAIGSSPDYFTYDSFEEVNYSTAGNNVAVATGGLGINLAAKRGTNAFRGSLNGFFTHDNLQWSNLPTELEGDPRLQGSDKADHTDQIFDWSADLGGPILKDRLWFYASIGENDIRVRRLNQSQDKTVLKTYTAKVNWQASPNDMISLFWFQGGKTKIGRTGAGGSREHLDGTLWDQGKAWPGQPHGLTKLEWNRTFGPSFFLNVKGSLYNTGFSLEPQGGLEDDRWIWDNVTQTVRGTVEGRFFERPQKTLTADSSYFTSGLGGSHQIQFGGGFRRVGSSSRRENPGQKVQGRFNTTSTRARFWRDRFTDSEADYWSAYLSDTFTRDRLTLTLGLRYDHQSSRKLPSQIAGNPLAPGGLLPDVDFAGDTEAPVTWSNLSPRVGLTLALDDTRQTVARASFAMYHGQLANPEAGWNNPLGDAYVEYDNGDEIVQMPEVDFSQLRGFAGIDPTDPDRLDNPYEFDPDYNANRDYEVVVGLDREIAPNLAASIAYTWRRSTNFTATQLLWGYYWYPWVGITRADYQPGEEFCDNGFCATPQVLNGAAFDRPEVTTGAILTNREDYRRTYNGIELAVVKRMSNNWMGRIAFTYNDWKENVGPNVFSGAGGGTANPNQHYFDSQIDGGIVAAYSAGSGKVYYNNAKWQIAANALYQLPAGFEVAASLLGRQGYPNPVYTWLDNGPLDGFYPVLAEGSTMDSQRFQDLWNLDLRLAKSLTVGPTTLTLSAEVFNAFNSNTDLTRINDFGSAAYQRLDEILAPRIVRFGARVMF
jgi:hypothetical protein